MPNTFQRRSLLAACRLSVGWMALTAMIPGSAAAPSAQGPRVVIETSLGEIEITLRVSQAPMTSSNFLRYLDGRFYEGGVFHRAVTPSNQPQSQVKIEVIQGGPNPAKEKDAFPPIQLERTRQTGLKHLNGTVSMARVVPDSATSDFFICLGDQPALDFGGRRNPDGQGFAAFGQVTRGMDVVRKIQASPAEGQTLKPPVRILKARRLP